MVSTLRSVKTIHKAPALASVVQVPLLAIFTVIFGTLPTAAAPAGMCVAASVDLSDLKPMEPSETQLQELVRSYTAPEVAGYATTLQQYAKGTAEPHSARELRAMSKSVAKSPFVLFTDDVNRIGGGYILRTLFPETSAMYRTWIYQDAGFGGWEVRASEQLPCSSAQQRWLKARYGVLARRVLEKVASNAMDPFSSDAPTLLVQGLQSEDEIRTFETAEVIHDIKILNGKLARRLFTGFSIRNVGTGPFQYRVDTELWATISEEQKHKLVAKDGPLYNESRRVYRKYHGGRIRFSDPDSYLTFRVVDGHDISLGLDYVVTAGSD